MNKGDTRPRKKTKGKRTRGRLLDRLHPVESASVLGALLEMHPELAPDAEELARAAMQEVDVEAVAATVGDAVCHFDMDDLGERSGRRRRGYVEPTEAAWELIQEAVAPFLNDLERLVDLGFRKAAIDMCTGIVLGLYRAARQSTDGPLAWAEECSAECACEAVSKLARGSASVGHERWSLPRAILDKTPDWAGMLDRVANQR
ncbi:hypothetical protein KJ682_01970 [bacterium]|nr:hypothetical protein [bacterium]